MRGQGAMELRCGATADTLKGQGATQLPVATYCPRLHAQGATEYLVLLAVVLVIALVAIALLGFFPGMAGDAQITQSEMYWKSATPIAITEWAARYAFNGVPPGYTHVYMKIRNTGSYPIRLNRLMMNGKNMTAMCVGTWTCTGVLSSIYLYPGEERIFGYPAYFPGIPDPGSGNRSFFVPDYNLPGAMSANCSRTAPYGTAAINNFGFEYVQYTDGAQITKQQIGTKPAMIRCMNNYD